MEPQPHPDPQPPQPAVPQVPPQVPMAQVSRVAIKVPPFWKANPKLWFRQLDSQFFNAGITNDVTKYHTLVGAVESDVLACVSDIILQPPTQNLYATLRQRLEENYSDSEEKQLRKLLSDLELGDKRPSQLLREMKDLSGSRVSDALLKSLWLQRLPTQIQAILTTSTDELAQLASMADKINEVISVSAPSVHAIVQSSSHSMPSTSSSTIQPQQSNNSTLDQIMNDIRTISKRIEALEQRTSSRARSTSRNRGKANEPTHFDGVCKYHINFKERAYKCIQPCSFSVKSSPNQSQSLTNSAENSQGRR